MKYENSCLDVLLFRKRKRKPTSFMCAESLIFLKASSLQLDYWATGNWTEINSPRNLEVTVKPKYYRCMGCANFCCLFKFSIAEYSAAEIIARADRREQMLFTVIVQPLKLSGCCRGLQ